MAKKGNNFAKDTCSFISDLLKWERFGTLILWSTTNEIEEHVMKVHNVDIWKGYFLMKCDGLVPVGKPLLTLEEEDRTRKEVSGVLEPNTKCLRNPIQYLVCICQRNAPCYSIRILMQLIQGNEERERVVPKCWKRAEGILSSRV